MDIIIACLMFYYLNIDISFLVMFAGNIIIVKIKLRLYILLENMN